MEIIYSTVVEHTSTVQIEVRVEAEEASSARPFLDKKTPMNLFVRIHKQTTSGKHFRGGMAKTR